MELEEAMEQWKPGLRICRKPNHRPHNYQPVFFTVQGETLLVHDLDNPGRRGGTKAAFQTSEHNDWILY